jgi:CHAT domain-containing protein/Tfp pilus assembly protein PilF
MHDILEDDHHYFGNNYINLGLLFQSKGDYEAAENYFLKALDNYRHSNPPYLAFACHYIGKLYLEIKDYGRALEYGRLAKKYSDLYEGDPGYYWEPGVAHLIMGSAYKGLTKRKKAEQLLREGIAIAALDTMGAGHIKGDLQYELGLTLFEMSKYEEAEQYFNKAIQTWLNYYGDGGKYEEIIKAKQQIARILEKEGCFEESLQIHHQILQDLIPGFNADQPFQNPAIEIIPLQRIVIDALEEKASCLERINSNTTSVGGLEEIAEIYDLLCELVFRMKLKYEWRTERSQLRELSSKLIDKSLNYNFELYQKTQNEAYLEQTFSIIEQSKAGTLYDNLNERRSRILSSIPETEIEEELKISRDISLYQKLIFEESQQNKPDERKLIYLNNILADLKVREKSIAENFKSNYPEFQEYLSIEKRSSLRDTKNWLEEGATIMNYYLGDSSMYLMTITKQSVELIRTKNKHRVVELVHAFRSQISNPPKTEEQVGKVDTKFHQLAKQLSQELNTSILSKERINKVYIIPEAELWYIPFELLLEVKESEFNQGEQNYYQLPFLFRAYNISYECSAQLLLNQRPERKKIKDYLGMAPGFRHGSTEEDYLPTTIWDLFNTRDELGPIPESKNEVKRAAEILEGDYLIEVDATKSNFQALAESYRILHLATHTIINDEHPSYSGLVFESSEQSYEYLQCYELYNMHLAAELVILSACNTNFGKINKGEGVSSLTEAFKYTGSPNIATSLWRAHDYTTKELMIRFIQNIKLGLEKDEALRQAKIDMIEDPKYALYAHPFYWGGFIYIGNTEAMKFDQKSILQWKHLPLFLLLIAIAVSLLLIRSRQLQNLE